MYPDLQPLCPTSLPQPFAPAVAPQPPPSFGALVDSYYAALYRFALGLIGDESHAADLTQQTFYVWAQKGHQLRDGSKAKAWLFTTLRREFLRARGRQIRFPQVEFNEWSENEPAAGADASVVDALDAAEVMRAVQEVTEIYRAPLLLFYVQDLSYAEIAAALHIRPGTVMSRLSRGKAELRARLAITASTAGNGCAPRGSPKPRRPVTLVSV